MNKTIAIAVLSGVLAGGILVSAGSIMADAKDSGQRTKSSVLEMKRGGMRGFGDRGPGFMVRMPGGLAGILDELVADGTITQGKADNISDFIAENEENMKAQRMELREMTKEEREAAIDGIKDSKNSILSQLVVEKIITQAEADAIQKKLQDKMETQRAAILAKQQEMAEERFDQLVTEGVISEGQAVKIKEFITAKGEERKAEMEKLKNMTEEERKAYFKEKADKNLIKNRGINIFDEMVDEGIISQDQAEKLAERKPGPGNFK